MVLAELFENEGAVFGDSRKRKLEVLRWSSARAFGNQDLGLNG